MKTATKEYRKRVFNRSLADIESLSVAEEWLLVADSCLVVLCAALEVAGSSDSTINKITALVDDELGRLGIYDQTDEVADSDE